jgi:hypothetical protein
MAVTGANEPIRKSCSDFVPRSGSVSLWKKKQKQVMQLLSSNSD